MDHSLERLRQIKTVSPTLSKIQEGAGKKRGGETSLSSFTEVKMDNQIAELTACVKDLAKHIPRQIDKNWNKSF